MNRLASHSDILPFGEFLEYLNRQGFIVGVDHHLRLQELLAKIGGQCTPNDLKTLLCPIFATNARQQEQFYRAFNNYFAIFWSTRVRGADKDVYKAKDEVELPPEPVAAKKWPYLFIGILLVTFIAVIGLFLTRPEISIDDQQIASQRVKTSDDTIRQEISQELKQKAGLITPKAIALDSATAWATRLQNLQFISTSTIKAPEVEFSFYQRFGNTIRWTTILAPLVFFLLYESYRYNRRKLVLQKQRGKKPPYVWPIKVDTPAPKLYKSEEFYTATRFMRQRQIGEIYRLDVDDTITATIESLGYPSFRYKPDTNPPEYLVLIDRVSFRDHQTHLFDILSSTLAQEGVFVVRYFYDGDPRLCYSDTSEGSVPLIELQRKYPGHRLIIFSNGKKLIDPITGRLENWTTVFSNWYDRALLTPETPYEWGFQEITLTSLFIVMPATVGGLLALVDHLITPDLRSWRQNSLELPPPGLNQPDTVARLRTCLGEATFQWLCVCAIYPELHWDLTLYLGSLSCMPEDLVNEKNLLRLIRLPWFRSGAMPDELRLQLISELDQNIARAVRLAIIELLEKNPAPAESFAYDTYHLNLVVQRWLLFRQSHKRRREMLQVMQILPMSQVMQDYAFLRFLESDRQSPLEFLLPRRLRKVFYKQGVPAFGLKTSVRLIATVILMTMAWIFIKPSKDELIYKTEPTKQIAEFSEIVPLVGGTFSMGSKPNEPNSLPSQRPRHNVNIAPFAIGKYEITNAQFVKFLADSGNQKEGGGSWLLIDSYFTKIKHMQSGEFVVEAGFENYPVVGVSWYGAGAYCRWLSRKTGIPFRLPTEAEWEYACRAGTETQYSFGDDSTNYDQYGWFLANSSFGPHEVGQKAPNQFGLYDMLGNMWEWCLDAWSPNYQNTPRDGRAVRPTGNELRVVRGSCWYDLVWRAQSAHRYNFVPILDINMLVGFRVAASLNDGYEQKKTTQRTIIMPTEQGFTQLHQGFEFLERSVAVEQDSFIVRIARVDQTQYAFRVLGRDPESDKALSLEQHQERTQAVCILNGGFRLSFEDNEPVGLVIINGKQLNPISGGLSGIFAVKNEKAEIVYTREYKQSENYAYAIQGNPVIVDKGGRIGVQKLKDKKDETFRAFIGIDKREKVIIGTTSAVSLYDLATYLTRKESIGGVDCDIVLNLEGGGRVVAMLIAFDNFRKEIDNVRNPVPNAICIFDRNQLITP